MKTREIFSFSFLLKLVFVSCLFVLFFISAVSYKHSLSLSDSSRWLSHYYNAEIELERIFSYLKDTEAGQREFLITKDSTFLDSYIEARQKVNHSVNVFRDLTKTNSRQQTNLNTLYALINRRFYLLSSTLDRAARREMTNEEQTLNLRPGKIVMDSISRHIAMMMRLEKAYLHETETRYSDEIFFTPLFNLLLFVFSLVVFVFSYLKINTDLQSFKRSNVDLLIKTETNKHAEEIGDFSSWQWNLETNKLIYSDNQYRLFGLEPQSFTPTIEKFIEFVHPDDRNVIADGWYKVINDNEPSTASFRIIRKDGAIRHFRSIGKLLTQSDGQKLIIGINRDVTSEYENSMSLEERNRQLEQTNKELASFNHVASHDLQEPLRKIETFISRISENEKDTLSEKGKEYFGRIQNAAGRMRVLIDDLLLFSHTTKVEKVFEKTDLNRILENAKQELIQTIEEKGAIIRFVNLPTVSVIPFQITQLFINLIGNALKYSKPGIPPEISIDFIKLSSKEDPVLTSDPAKKYFRISFKDNGLGFDQQYAETIFVLFQRLYHQNEYPGTGIGLAICKKIVENHAGIITAESKPGEGSVFLIYLPAV